MNFMEDPLWKVDKKEALKAVMEADPLDYEFQQFGVCEILCLFVSIK